MSVGPFHTAMGTILYCETLVCFKRGREVAFTHAAGREVAFTQGYGKNLANRSRIGTNFGWYGKVNQKRFT